MWLRWCFLLAALCVLAPGASAQSNDGKRIALVIGNQAYADAVGPLKNPHNDIKLVGAALAALGFDVTPVKDADYGTLEKAIKGHIARVRSAGAGAISFVYYSGHGALTDHVRPDAMDQGRSPGVRDVLLRAATTGAAGPGRLRCDDSAAGAHGCAIIRFAVVVPEPFWPRLHQAFILAPVGSCMGLRLA